MANLKNVIYISNSDYQTLVTTGTVTIGGEILTYDADNLYITPDTGYVLNSSSTTSSGAVTYLESGTTKYLHTGTTSVLTGVTADGTATVLTGVKVSSTAKGGSETHTHSVTATGSVSLGSNTTSTDGVPYLESQGTITGASYTPAGSVTVTENDATATGRITYVKSVTGGSASGTGAGSAAPSGHTHSYDTYSLSGSNASGTTKYMKFNAGTTPPSGATPSHTSTTSGAASGTAVAAVTGYGSFSGGSGSFTPTTKYLSASFSGTATTSLVTGIAYHSTNTAALYGNRTTSGSGTAARRTLEIKTYDLNVTKGSYTPAGSVSLTANAETGTGYITYIESATHSHTAASLGTPSTSNAAPASHTHSYDKTTGVSLTPGTAPSMNFNTGTSTDTPYISAMTDGSLSLTTNTSAGTTGQNSGTAVSTISGVSYTAPTITTKYLSASFGGTAATITPTLSAGTTKYFHPSFSGTAATSGGPSATTDFATAVGSNGTATALTGVKANGTASAVTSITVNTTSTDAVTAFIQSAATKYLTLEEEN